MLNGNANTTGPLSNWLNTGPPTPANPIPKAYINWVFFDEQFKPLTSGSSYDPIWASADYVKHHAIYNIAVPRSGYVYIYCSNESNQDVYFDNLQVVHTKGAVLEEQSYYPFGGKLAGISSQAAYPAAFSVPQNQSRAGVCL